MLKKVVCESCNSILQYDDRSTWEGNREHEDVICPVCKNIVDCIFTDLIPIVHVIERGNINK